MKKTLLAFAALMVLAVLFVGARTMIMKLEMKDGTVRYINTEALDEFNFIQLDEIPESQSSRYLTETKWKNAYCYHSGFFSGRTLNTTLEYTYVPNEPDGYTYTLKNWAEGCKPIQLFEKDEVLTVPCQSTGYIDDTYGEIWVADRETYATEVLGAPYTGFDFPKYITDRYDDPIGLDLPVVYYAPAYGDGKTFAQESNEEIYDPDFLRVYYNIEALRTDSVSQPYIEITFEKAVDLPTKICASYGYVEVDDLNAFYETENSNQLINDLSHSTWERCYAKDYDLVIELTDSASYTLKIPFSGQGYAAVYASVFDLGDEPEYDTNPNHLVGGLQLLEARIPEPKKEVYSGTYKFNIFYGSNNYAYLTRVSPIDASKDVNYELYIPEANMKLPVRVPDMEARTNDGYIPVEVDSTYINYTSSSYGRVFAADYKWYCLNYLPTVREGFDPIAVGAQNIPPSVMEPGTCALRLNLIYFVPEYGTGTSAYGYDYEYFIPDHTFTTLEESFGAEFQETDEANKGIINIHRYSSECGIAAYKVAVTSGNIGEIATAIMYNPGDYPTYRCTGDFTEVTVDYEYDKNQYAVVLAYNNEGKYLGATALSFIVRKPVDMSDYDYLGNALLYDGWCVPAFTIDGRIAQAIDFPWEVEIYRSKTDPCEYLLDQPWADGPMASLNSTPELAKKAQIEIRIEGENVLIMPQSTGFSRPAFGGTLTIANPEGYYMTMEPEKSLSQIVEDMEPNMRSSFDGEIITIQLPVYGVPEAGIACERIYNPVQAAYIVMPDSPGYVARKAAAKAAKAALEATSGSDVRIDAVKIAEKTDPVLSKLHKIAHEKIQLTNNGADKK